MFIHADWLEQDLFLPNPKNAEWIEAPREIPAARNEGSSSGPSGRTVREGTDDAEIIVGEADDEAIFGRGGAVGGDGDGDGDGDGEGVDAFVFGAVGNDSVPRAAEQIAVLSDEAASLEPSDFPDDRLRRCLVAALGAGRIAPGCEVGRPCGRPAARGAGPGTAGTLPDRSCHPIGALRSASHRQDRVGRRRRAPPRAARDRAERRGFGIPGRRSGGTGPPRRSGACFVRAKRRSRPHLSTVLGHAGGARCLPG